MCRYAGAWQPWWAWGKERRVYAQRVRCRAWCRKWRCLTVARSARVRAVGKGEKALCVEVRRAVRERTIWSTERPYQWERECRTTGKCQNVPRRMYALAALSPHAETHQRSMV